MCESGLNLLIAASIIGISSERRSGSTLAILKRIALSEKNSGSTISLVDTVNMRFARMNPVNLLDASIPTRIAQYAESITEEIKPLIDYTFRTLTGRDSTAVCGFSAGAAAYVYLVLRKNSVFSGAGAFSFTMSKTMESYLAQETDLLSKIGKTRIYMDVGDCERDDLPQDVSAFFVDDPVKALTDWQKYLHEREEGSADTRLRIIHGGYHRISAAAQRVGGALLWLFNDGD